MVSQSSIGSGMKAKLFFRSSFSSSSAKEQTPPCMCSGNCSDCKCKTQNNAKERYESDEE